MNSYSVSVVLSYSVSVVSSPVFHFSGSFSRSLTFSAPFSRSDFLDRWVSFLASLGGLVSLSGLPSFFPLLVLAAPSGCLPNTPVRTVVPPAQVYLQVF